MATGSGDVLAGLPERPVVRRADEVPGYSMSPTEVMRFFFSSSASVTAPEFYEERAGRGDSPPLHRHPWPEWFHLLEGEVRIVAEGEEIALGPGDSLYLPAGVVHTFVIESDTARYVGFSLSGGRFYELSRNVAPMLAVEGGPDMGEVTTAAAAHGVELLGPPLSPSAR